MFGGFYIVPLYALIQERSEPAFRSRIIAANNILNALFMVASAGIALGLLKAGCTIPQLFLATGLMNALVAIYIYLAGAGIPDALPGVAAGAHASIVSTRRGSSGFRRRGRA